MRLAQLAVKAGCHGVVASSEEARLLREVLPHGRLIITPGIQLAGDDKNDHVRIATPAEAIRAGSTHVMMGCSITRASNPLEAFNLVTDLIFAEQGVATGALRREVVRRHGQDLFIERIRVRVAVHAAIEQDLISKSPISPPRPRLLIRTHRVFKTRLTLVIDMVPTTGAGQARKDRRSLAATLVADA